MKKLALIVVLTFGLGLVLSGLAVADDYCEGCTPGYWKNLHKHEDSWMRVYPEDYFSDIFKVDTGDLTLIDALKRGGGGEKALGRQAVAALLNALSPDLDYPLAAIEVISIVQRAYRFQRFEAAKDYLESFNDQFCPLD
jgi:hypothetical protein